MENEIISEHGHTEVEDMTDIKQYSINIEKILEEMDKDASVDDSCQMKSERTECSKESSKLNLHMGDIDISKENVTKIIRIQCEKNIEKKVSNLSHSTNNTSNSSNDNELSRVKFNKV
jgi:hypothetical protein